jgi:hypothetical protein
MDQNSWATAFDRFWGDLEPGSRALLMLEPLLLMHVAELAGLDFDTVEEAESNFLQTVRAYIRGKVRGPWDTEPYRPGTPPRFLLQIAVQVYAASKMADAPDGHHTSAAYYVQLEELVGESGAKERFNSNDQGEYHQTLWRGRLAEWAKHKGLVLELPADRDGAGRHVQLPKSQAALRVGDLQRLPVFFGRSGFRTFDPENPEAMERQIKTVARELERRKHDFACFSNWAQRVLDDDLKFPMAVIQVEEALKSWDGRLWIRDAGRRADRQTKQDHCVWLTILKRRQRLKASSGSTSASARPLSIADLSSLLSGEIIGEDRFDIQGGLTLFRYEEEDGAFKQSGFVDAGDQGLLASGPRQSVDWNRLFDADNVYHSPQLHTSEAGEHWEKLEGVPDHCVLFQFRVVERLPSIDAIPEIWRPFLRLPSAGLSLSGGLRIGRTDHFVAGAGPRLKISGNFLPTFILVDGQRVDINSRIVRLDQFSQPGEHEIVACFDGKRISKHFKVSLPDNAVPREFPSDHWQLGGSRWPAWVDDQLDVRGGKDSETHRIPSVFGVLARGLDVAKDKSLHPDDERLIAIRLLAGMPIPDASSIQLVHPLVKQLLTQQTNPERQAVTT